LIFIKTIVMPDINIPALLEDIQLKVKKSVEETTGIVVNEVKVSVENTYTGYSPELSDGGLVMTNKEKLIEFTNLITEK